MIFFVLSPRLREAVKDHFVNPIPEARDVKAGADISNQLPRIGVPLKEQIDESQIGGVSRALPEEANKDREGTNVGAVRPP